MSTSTEPQAPGSPGQITIDSRLAWGLASAVAIAIGSVGTWFTAGPFSVAGTTGGGDGWFTLAVGVIATIVIAARRLTWITLPGALIALGIGIGDAIRFLSQEDDGGEWFGGLALGWGLIVVIAAAASLAAWGALALRAAPRGQRTAAGILTALALAGAVALGVTDRSNDTSSSDGATASENTEMEVEPPSWDTSTDSVDAEPIETETAPTEAEADAGDEAEESADGCQSVEAPEPASSEPKLSKPDPARLTGTATVTMTTNCGRFTIRLDTRRQPKTAASFHSLVRKKFYDGLTFHRLADGFVIQGGDPQGDGTGGPGYSITEAPPADASYTRGLVAMAKTGDEQPGTSGSQFFIVTGKDIGLPPDYAIVGEVTSGMDTVERIAAVGSSGPPSDTPLQPVVIEKATVSGS